MPGTAPGRADGVLVVEVSGELDIATVLRWTAVFEAAACELPQPLLLVVDLSLLAFLSARGAVSLFSVFDHCHDRGIDGCLIAAPGTPVRRVVHLSALDQRVPVFPDRLAAIAASQPVQVRWLHAQAW